MLKEIDLGVQSSVFHTPEGSPDVWEIALRCSCRTVPRATARAKIGRLYGEADCAVSEEP